MSNAAKLKKRAVELEQKKQFDKALSLYVQFLKESDGALDDADVPLYNRVGDLMLRVGNTSEALNYYERAVDLYAERGFHNNAIALCNKVLRQSPGRSSIYYKLGKISATKGFKSDAKKNFLEYADRMQKAGHIDEAFRALKEFADLCPDQDDIRLMLAEQLSKENRQQEALEQLQKLHDKLDSEGRTAEARATVDRMKAIDPEAVPRSSGSYPPQKSSDLIFLDTSFEQGSRDRQRSVPTTRQVSDPDLVVLTLADQPDTPLSPVHNAAVADALGLDLELPDTPAPAADDLPLLDIGDAGDLGSGVGVPAVGADTGDAAGTVAGGPAVPDAARGDAIEALDLDIDAAGTTFDLPSDTGLDVLPVDASAGVDHDTAGVLDALELEPDAQASEADGGASRYVSGPPLGIDYASDLAADVSLPAEDTSGALFDFRAPPRTDTPADAPALGTLDPDVEFPSFDLGDTSLPSADEITSGGSLAAALGGTAPADGIDDFELDVDDATTMVSGAVPASAEDAPGESRADDTVAGAGGEVSDADAHELELPELELPGVAGAASAGPTDSGELDVAGAVERTALSGAPGAVPDEVRPARAPAADARAQHGSPATAATSSGAAPARREPEPAGAAPPPTWESRRAHAERLLELGDRAGGVRELEQMAAELERAGDLERALTITDELIRLAPDSIRHHQKRVEFAFRSNDRGKLIDAYIELGDALFRAGEEQKARVVYQRVLELAPQDARARAALESVASLSPPAGSGTIAAEQRPAAASSNGSSARPEAAQSPSLRPAPLDRRAAMNGDFVDLGEWLRSDENPKSTRMVAEEKPPTGDEQADFQEMLKRFKQGVADNVDEEDHESHYDLGVAYKEMGLIDEAVAEFQKALRGSAHRVRAYEALGQCFVEKEQYQVAASVLSRAMALGEGDDHHLVGVLYLLGRATEALSKPSDALDYYQRVFAVDIEFRDVAERISAIERKAT